MNQSTSMKQKKHTNEDGFTLVEVMVVMVIIGLLTTFVVLNVLPSQDKAMAQKAKGDIRLLEQAVEMYRLDLMDYPEEQEGLAALKSAPAGLSKPQLYRKGGYVKFLPKDPWGNDYIYKYPGDNGVVDIMSYGADGERGGEGLAADIVNWEP